MKRVWFYRPQWYWFGWRTLIPFYFSSNEMGWRTLVIGWTVTGRIVIALTEETGEALRELRGWLGEDT